MTEKKKSFFYKLYIGMNNSRLLLCIRSSLIMLIPILLIGSMASATALDHAEAEVSGLYVIPPVPIVIVSVDVVSVITSGSIAPISHASKVVLKSSKLGFNRM